jgi:hypothetical protein
MRRERALKLVLVLFGLLFPAGAPTSKDLAAAWLRRTTGMAISSDHFFTSPFNASTFLRSSPGSSIGVSAMNAA